MIEIVAAGPLTTVQDDGRFGYVSLGITRAGAFDGAAYALGNRIVGNAPGAAALEITLGGLAFRVDAAVTVALTGARCAGLEWGHATTLPAGSEWTLAAPADGMRSYLAVRGGINVPVVLGSRSADLGAGLGPPRVQVGDRLRVGAQPGTPVDGADAIPRPMARSLAVVLGPRDAWFTADAVRSLLTQSWTVRPESDRVGLRLDGAGLDRVVTAELPSEPTRPGALQVPADGRPILLGPDAPTTGGYPVIAVVTRAGLDHAAQLRPGQSVRFHRDAARDADQCHGLGASSGLPHPQSDT